MSDAGFEIHGLEEMQNDIKQMFKSCPEELGKKIYSLAGKFTKDVNEKFPAEYASGKNSLRKAWKREREKTIFTGFTVAVNVMNTAPHFHLVENGHIGKIPENGLPMHQNNNGSGEQRRTSKSRKNKPKMRTIGFIPGKHYCERTRNEWQDKFKEEMEKFIDKLLREHRL